jgi:hypothetical protein
MAASVPASTFSRSSGSVLDGRRLNHRGRGGTHVVHGQDRSRAGLPRERRADRFGHILVQLVGYDSPDVIRLEDAREITH